MPDFLHPNAKGYEVWAKAMEPLLVELMGESESIKPTDRPPPTLDCNPIDNIRLSTKGCNPGNLHDKLNTSYE